MLDFKVKNFRSIKDEQELSLLASVDRSLPNNASVVGEGKEGSVLNSAVIYGANASGKSNLIIAISLLRNFVLQSHLHQKGGKLNHQPFAFGLEMGEEQTDFEIGFIKNEVKYQYHLAYNANEVTEEDLYHYPNNRKALIFSRRGQVFEFTKDQKEQEIISRRTLENALYLSSSVQFNYKATMPAFEWFLNDLIVLETTIMEPLIDQVIDRMNRNKKMKNDILRALKIADLGIVGIKGKVRKVPLRELDGKIPPQLIGMMTLGGGQFVERDLRFTHAVEGEGGKIEQFDLGYQFESEGTRRLFSIIGPIIESLNEGKTIVIDELDTKLHHSLSAWLIGLFHDPGQNKKGAQLIFNTHDQQLLDQSLFRRDQIWFVEKDPKKGCSELFSLAEFGERKDRDILKAYQQGRYGAVPFIPSERVVS